MIHHFQNKSYKSRSIRFDLHINFLLIHSTPSQGWVFDVTEYEGETSTAGGSFALARAAADVKGDGAYHLLKFEAGVHRVQR